MSKTAIVSWIAVAIVVILGLWYALTHQTPAVVTQQNIPTTAISQLKNPMIASPNDTTDAALAKDTAAVDAQLKGVTSDQVGINTSIGK